MKGGLASSSKRNYEDFIEDHRKREGRDGLDLAMGDRHSRSDISRAVLSARLHIIRKVLCVDRRPPFNSRRGTISCSGPIMAASGRPGGG